MLEKLAKLLKQKTGLKTESDGSGYFQINHEGKTTFIDGEDAIKELVNGYEKRLENEMEISQFRAEKIEEQEIELKELRELTKDLEEKVKPKKTPITIRKGEIYID